MANLEFVFLTGSEMHVIDRQQYNSTLYTAPKGY